MKKPTLKKLEKLAKNFQDTKQFEFTEYDFTLSVQQYLSIEQKKSLVEDVVLRCVAENDGVQYIHTYLSHIAKNCAIIRFYSNIELPEDNFEAYNMLNHIPKIYEQALSMMPENELKEIDVMINKFAEDLRFNQMYSNSVETVVKQALDKLVAKLPSLEEANKFIADSSKEIKGFDPNSLKMIGQVLGWNNGVDIDGNKES